ncbi:MAG: adenylyl-sulfate kinase [Candidatus Hydrogenedentota bacterium]|nr:MAG: adenylyl-sulfate kinase [Candidatus Hydrogenedentota bacterium]
MEDRRIVWHKGRVDKKERVQRMGWNACTLWLTGLSGSGKSTIAYALEYLLLEHKVHAFVLDGDNIRHGLNRDLGFSKDDREENIRRIGEVARLFVEANVFSIVSFISPFREDRNRARSLHDEGDFFEIFIDCPLEICEQRDPKGLYKEARAGKIPDFTGIDSPYEPPLAPEIHLRTDQTPLKECLDSIWTFLLEKHRLG